ncbi:MAG: D-aminoacyl-tRNA deacylase [Gemmatimonadota bacterium]|nr:D-aminoacyl-tRNA deacylase [Gemmatimonadota bacterium]
MKVLLQRVARARVTVSDREIGAIAAGFVALVGFTHGDGAEQVQWMADKIAGLRVFSDAEGKMNLAITDVGGGVLVVSQFTLYGDAQKGRRPSFIQAAHPDAAVPLYEMFVIALRERALPVQTGEFGAEMQVELVNDGPVTLLLER